MLRRSIGLADTLVLRRVVRRLPPPVASVVSGLGHAASGGGLWFASAAALLLCGRRGRRGAGSGLVAYAITSGLANGPAKWLVRRPRPAGPVLVGLPRRGHRPPTSSFPSSHTAGGFAFAVAASIELPVSAPLLLPAAAGVALARMRALRHHPSDVVAGALLGVGMGAATAYALRHRRQRHAAG